jgi:hypothetical protein
MEAIEKDKYKTPFFHHAGRGRRSERVVLVKFQRVFAGNLDVHSQLQLHFVTGIQRCYLVSPRSSIQP